MNDLANELRRRAEARGPNGEHLSLLTGSESLEELKDLIVFLCQDCPAWQNHPHCPFRIMSGLSYASLTKLVEDMPHTSCVNLFEMELNCRSQGEFECRPGKDPPQKKPDDPAAA